MGGRIAIEISHPRPALHAQAHAYPHASGSTIAYRTRCIAALEDCEALDLVPEGVSEEDREALDPVPEGVPEEDQGSCLEVFTALQPSLHRAIC